MITLETLECEISTTIVGSKKNFHQTYSSHNLKYLEWKQWYGVRLSIRDSLQLTLFITPSNF